MADTIYNERKDFIGRYPGRWTMTTDLLLIPERMDFDNPSHVFGFDTKRVDALAVPGLILMGLELFAANEPEEFALKGVRLKVEHHGIESDTVCQSIADFQSTQFAHDIRCILGRNFLQ